VFSIFKVFYSEKKNQFNSDIKILRSDNAKEYLSNTFSQFLESRINPHMFTLLNRMG